jgi:transposase
MFLKQVPNKKTNRIFLSISRGYRNNQGKTRTVTVQSLGYLDELQKQYDDPVSYFKKVASDMNQEMKELNKPQYFKISTSDTLTDSLALRKNFGYSAFSKIYHELGIDNFFQTKFSKLKVSPNKLNNIFKLLVFGRLIFPDSKKSTYENKDMLFENTDFSLKDVYRFLDYIEPKKNELTKYIYDHSKQQYKRNTECLYYDVTNYYFEIDEPDELRKKGVSKEHRPDPIIQMGLFQDGLGIPLNYKLFEGNTNDSMTMRPILSELQEEYNIKKVIVVADKALNTGNNITYNVAMGNGYVFSQRVRGANPELREFVLNEDGYIHQGEDYKIKSRIYPREIIITGKNETKKKVRLNEKQVVFWSKDYDRRAKAERQPSIDLAKELIGNVTRFNKKNSHSASKYVKQLVFDSKTGEIIAAKSKLLLDEEKIKEEEKYDGYYAIVTSELDKTDTEIIDIYRELWRIEETFKITKSELESRPVYVTRKEHIEAHFLICFISLVLVRLLQQRLDKKYSARQIIDSLAKCNCSYVQENYWLFDYTDDIMEDIGNILGIKFNQKFRSLQDIKKILGNMKKI